MPADENDPLWRLINARDESIQNMGYYQLLEERRSSDNPDLIKVINHRWNSIMDLTTRDKIKRYRADPIIWEKSMPANLSVTTEGQP